MPITAPRALWRIRAANKPTVSDVPPAPVHVNVYTVAPAAAGVTVRLPLAAAAGGVKFVAGLAAAVHEVEVGSSVDQESVVELPNGIDVAASVSVGTTKAPVAWMNP